MTTTPPPAGFTPGPWTAVSGQGVHYRDWYIRAGERQEDGSWPAVAKCCSSRIGGLIAVQSNARLIAASPDLYAACRAMYDEMVVNPHPGTLHLLNQAEAAIAKAGGGA